MAAALSPSSCGIEGFVKAVWPGRHWTTSCQKMPPRTAGKQQGETSNAPLNQTHRRRRPLLWSLPASYTDST